MAKNRKLFAITSVALVVVALLIVGIVYRTANAPVTSRATKAPVMADQPKQATKPSFNTRQFSTTDPASPWVVVNKQHPLNPIDYAPNDLVSVGNNQVMRAEAAGKLKQLFGAAADAGYTLIAASAYRSYTTQVQVYNSEVTNYGQGQADSESARPGYSEHQTGWAVDIGGGGCNIDDCFANTPEGKWTAANAYTYGFILRYTPADTAVTGYRAEAWHYRYVGTALATYMHDNNIATLEQIFNITGGTDYKS